MKTTKFLIASLLILIGMGAITISCNKQKSSVNKAQLIIENATAKDGGDDDEDPVILAKVKKQNLTPVDSALVETVTYGTNVNAGFVYTNEDGEFEQKVEAGIYYFKVTAPGETVPYVTDTVHVFANVELTIIIE